MTHRLCAIAPQEVYEDDCALNNGLGSPQQQEHNTGKPNIGDVAAVIVLAVKPVWCWRYVLWGLSLLFLLQLECEQQETLCL